MVERSHAKLKKIIRKITVNTDSPQCDRYIDIAIMAHNTTYHDSLECSPTEIFQGRVPYNPIDLQFRKLLKQAETKCKGVNEILAELCIPRKVSLHNLRLS